MSKKDFILYIIFGVFFITIYFWSNTLIRSAASWPKMVSVIGLVLSFIGIFRYLFRLIKKNPANSEVYPVINKKIVLRSLFLIIIMLIWIASIKLLGFLFSSLIAINIIVQFFTSTRNFKKYTFNFCITSIIVAGMYYLFILLGVSFPAGKIF
jgi:hypothetical protein